MKMPNLTLKSCRVIFPHFIILLTVCLLFGACQQATKGERIIALLQEKQLDQAAVVSREWLASGDTSAIPGFLLSFTLFMQDKSDSMNMERERCFAGKQTKEQQIAAWLDTEVASMPTSGVQQFLLGISAQLHNQPDSALQFFASAQRQGMDSLKCRYAALSLDKNGWSALIPKENPIRYVGTMHLSKIGAWIPMKNDFKLKSGTLLTRLGDMTCEATFSDFDYLRRENDSSQIYYWTPVMTSGQVLIQAENKEQNQPLKGELAFVCDATAPPRKMPFDFFGKYILLQLDSTQGKRLPLFVIPYFLKKDKCSSTASLGEKLVVHPNHFTQCYEYDCDDNPFCMIEDGAIYQTGNSFLGGMSYGKERLEWFGKLRMDLEKDGKMWGKVD